MNTHQVQEKSYKKISMITSALAIIGLLACYVFFGSGKKADWKVIKEPVESQEREVARELVEFLQGKEEKKLENLLSELRKNFRFIQLTDGREITFFSRGGNEKISMSSLDSNGSPEKNLREVMRINQTSTIEALRLEFSKKNLDVMGKGDSSFLSWREEAMWIQSCASNDAEDSKNSGQYCYSDFIETEGELYFSVSLWNELGFTPLSIQLCMGCETDANTVIEDVSFLMGLNLVKVRINPLQEENEGQTLKNDEQTPILREIVGSHQQS